MSHKPINRMDSFQSQHRAVGKQVLVLRLIVSILISIAVDSLVAQEFKLNDADCIEIAGVDCSAPAWSPDGERVAFQGINEGQYHLYCYNPGSGDIERLLSGKSGFSNPVWHPGGDQIIFDSDSLGYSVLFGYSLSEKKIFRLIYREVIGKEASFASSGRQVYFSGFDKTRNVWQIFSYDFVYDNLNQLTENECDSHFPEVAPDGKKIIYHKPSSSFIPEKYLLINWYGEQQTEYEVHGGSHLCWEPQGLKFYFIQKDENGKNQLYSMWSDGSHQEQHTFGSLNFSHPAISPDGKQIILTAEEEGLTKLYKWSIPE